MDVFLLPQQRMQEVIKKKNIFHSFKKKSFSFKCLQLIIELLVCQMNRKSNNLLSYTTEAHFSLHTVLNQHIPTIMLERLVVILGDNVSLIVSHAPQLSIGVHRKAPALIVHSVITCRRAHTHIHTHTHTHTRA